MDESLKDTEQKSQTQRLHTQGFHAYEVKQAKYSMVIEESVGAVVTFGLQVVLTRNGHEGAWGKWREGRMYSVSHQGCQLSGFSDTQNSNKLHLVSVLCSDFTAIFKSGMRQEFAIFIITLDCIMWLINWFCLSPLKERKSKGPVQDCIPMGNRKQIHWENRYVFQSCNSALAFILSSSG